MKKLSFKITCLLLVLLISAGLFCACDLLNDQPEYEALTVEDIEKEIQEMFFDSEGNLQTWRWHNIPHGNTVYPEIRQQILQIEEVESYEVTLVKTLNETYNMYLVEFEPFGFMFGEVHQKVNRENLSGVFWPYQSPFKMLNIPEEERYILLISAVGLPLADFATKRNGLFYDIKDEAYRGTIWEIPGHYVPHAKYLDVESYEWIEEEIPSTEEE